ncbi:BspA family leucine-rich repeat surface protein [Enterococcus faecalis]|uniref:BspA family leucine-rich repeat surface protein n=1 Tax=Enterococcus faecalis TaxID=1351 RepID=UPI000FFE4959|nr:BspA family leucine-rich repeat surface protein [Enterococcus faecalis]RXF26299.1 BspA family leucine-rich repeat surface protein [Enterococcus faecalis]
MKRKKYAYLFATTVLLANVATTPITVIAETMQENSSSEVAEKAEKQEKNQEEPLNSSEQDTSESDNETAEYTNNTQQQEDSSTPIEQAPSQPNNNESTQDNTKIESNLEKEIVETSDDLKEAKVQDWKVEENDDYVLLVRYEGDNKNLVVPNEINGKPTKLKGINEGVIPNLKSLEGFTVRPSTTGQMVGLDNTSLVGAFSGSTIVSINLSGLDTSQVTDMTNMFSSCSKLTSLDLSSFNTSQVTSMEGMFSGCSGLTSLNVSNFDTSAVTQMNGMFTGCSGLTSLNVSNFDTSAVTNMHSMFKGCSGLTSLNVSSVSFKTDKVTEMTDMFAGCSGLTSLDVSRFNTSEVKSMDGMFSDCTGLKSLDLSSFNTGKVTKMTYMFAYCNSLTYLDLSNFDMSQVSQMDVMFLADEELPLLVKTNDSKLLSYDYSADLRYPGGPKFEANGGSFSPDSKEETKYYFEKCAVPVDSPKFALATFNEFRNNLKPTKEGNVFSRWKVTSGSEPVNDEQLLSPVTYMAQWRTGETGGVNIPSQDVDNTKPGEISSYGIAYMPKQFQTNRTVLNDAGPQSIPVNKTERFDVGVQDLRNTTSQWTLKAQLMWDGGKELPGSSIKTTNKTGVVMKNINNGTDPFNPDMDLTDSNNEVQGESDVTITNVPTLIMTANNVSHNAVYNYNQGDVSLEIPETRMIQPGSYEGHVEWNLANTL